MWQRFTERARRAVFFAQEEAAKLSSNYVNTEHLLLGLIREADSAAARVLSAMGISTSRVRATLDRTVTRGNATAQDLKNMQLTPRSKRVIDLAYDEAREMKVGYIGSEHLLIGLLREDGGTGGDVLRSLGATVERARVEARLLSDETQQRPVEVAVTPAAEDPTRPAPRPGDLGMLIKEHGDRRIEMPVDGEVLDQLKEAWATRDYYAWNQLARSGRMLLLNSGTFVKYLREHEDHGRFFVRVLEGEHAGAAGYILGTHFRRIGPDERPFPPAQEIDAAGVLRAVGDAATAILAEGEAEGTLRPAGKEGGGYIQLTRLSQVPSPVRLSPSLLHRYRIKAGDLIRGFATPPEPPAQLWQMQRITRVNNQEAREAAPDDVALRDAEDLLTLDIFLAGTPLPHGAALQLSVGLPPLLHLPNGMVRRYEGVDHDLTEEDLAASIALLPLTEEQKAALTSGAGIEIAHQIPEGQVFTITVFAAEPRGADPVVHSLLARRVGNDTE